MKDTDDTQPFPIQGELRNRRQPASFVPNWLAELAYREYASRHDQSFARIAERGGFSRAELVALIRGDYSNDSIKQAQKDLDEKGRVQ